MKNFKIILSLVLCLAGSYAFSQNITTSSPITLPQAPATEHIIAPGSQKTVIMSATSITLLPGTHFQAGSDVLLKIGEVSQEARLSIVEALPSVHVNQDYTPWLNDDFNDLVKPDLSPENNQYIDVRLNFVKKAELTRVSLFDDQGPITHPVSIYAVNNSQLTLIGTFDGKALWTFVNFPVSPALMADGIVIRKFGNDLPLKVQAFGRLLPDGNDPAPLSIALINKTDIACFGAADGHIEVSADGGNVVYKTVYTGENAGRGAKIYSYSIDGATYQKSGLFTNLAPGNYTVYARDAFNLIKQLNVQITQPEKLFISESITPISCPGDCFGAIALTISGGTAPYAYSWPSHPAYGNTASISNLCTGVYKVVVTDARGCQIEKAIEMSPGGIQFAAIKDLILCQNQKAQLNAGNPGASYSWTSTNGFTSAQQSVEITQAGDYSLTISNAFGCAKTKTFRVDVSADSFKGDFLVSSVVNVGDTVYVIDISKPVPTAVNWFLPSQARVISTNDNNSIKQVVFEATGDYTITMNASRGECSEGITKSVKVIEKANKEATNLALGYKDELVKKLTVFPNPSSGQFTVGVELSSTENVRIRLIGLSSNQLIETKEAAGKKLYEVPFNHPELNPGIYFVTVEAGTAVKTLKIIIL